MIKKWLYWLWRVLPIPKRLRGPILWLGNSKYIIGIAALIRNQQGDVLLFKHTYRTDSDWGFPGGYLKWREDPQAAMSREIFEEAGFKIWVIQPLEVILTPQMARLEVLYEAELVGEMTFTPSHEVVDARFFPLESLPEILPEHRALIEKYCVPEKGNS